MYQERIFVNDLVGWFEGGYVGVMLRWGNTADVRCCAKGIRGRNKLSKGMRRLGGYTLLDMT